MCRAGSAAALFSAAQEQQQQQQQHGAMQQQLVWRTTQPVHVHQDRHTQRAGLTHPAVPLAVPLQTQAVDGPLRSRGDGQASSGLMSVHVQAWVHGQQA